MIESVKVHERHKNVIVVTDINLANMHYLDLNGMFIPGRVWVTCLNDGHRVHFFVPIEMGSFPEVLEVEEPS